MRYKKALFFMIVIIIFIFIINKRFINKKEEIIIRKNFNIKQKDFSKKYKTKSGEIWQINSKG